MQILELFSGTASFGNICKERGHSLITLDNDKSFNPDIVMDILDFNINEYLKNHERPDVIWSSIPCTTFSVASISTHWKKEGLSFIPLTKEAEIGLKIVEKTKEIISQLKPRFFIIENPRGILRKVININIKPVTVTYCQYGDKRMKPTDIWTNFEFIGKRCKNKDKCHESAPRGSRTGTQGIKDAKNRSIIPRDLCLEIIKTIEETQWQK